MPGKGSGRTFEKIEFLVLLFSTEINEKKEKKGYAATASVSVLAAAAFAFAMAASGSTPTISLVTSHSFLEVSRSYEAGLEARGEQSTKYLPETPSMSGLLQR